MTPGMQVRLWFRRASARQRAATIAVVALLVLALIGSVAIAPGSDDAHRVSTSAAGPADTDTSSATPGDAGLTTDATNPTGGGATAGGTSPATGSRGSQPGGATLPGGNAAGGGGPTAAVARVASDRGITAGSIKLGFLPANIGGIAAAGYALNIRTDVPQYIQALADSVNKGGGINGRKVEVAVRRTDPTSQSDQAAACESMVNDAKVFGVVDVGALADTPAFECLASRHKTPYVHNTIWDTKWLARSGGMEVGYQAAIDRISKTWARDLSAMGWLGKDATVGIIGDNCAATSPAIDQVLKPEFARLPGVKKVVVAKHGCDLQSVVTQPGSFVTQFRAAGVTHVLVAAVFVAISVFLSSAQNQDWHPKYAVSDWWQATSDASAANYNPNQFDGAVGISSLGLMLPSSGKPPYPGGERCIKVATDAGLEALKYDGRNQELWAMCDNFFLMVDGIRNAGVNPTRQAWAQAIQRLGSHPSVMFGPSEFHSGKVTGSDQVHTLRWQRGCRCYKSVSGFRPAAA